MSNQYVVAFDVPVPVSPLALPGMQTSNPYRVWSAARKLLTVPDATAINPGKFADLQVFCNVPMPGALGWKYFGTVHDSDPDASGFVTVNVVRLENHGGAKLDPANQADAINRMLHGSRRVMRADNTIRENITNLFLPALPNRHIRIKKTAKKVAVASRAPSSFKKHT